MYFCDKPRPIDFYKEEGREMMIEVTSNGGLPFHHRQMILAENSGEDPDLKAPKKRAETWVQEETRSLINLRREMDSLFNTSKSNKHLWEEISSKMRDKGFDRSPTMCTDKWRNLLKDFKKAKHQYRSGGTVKLPYYTDVDELLKDRSKNEVSKNPIPSKVDSYLQFSEKGLDESSIPYNSLDGNGRSSLNLESRLDHDGHPLAITSADAAATGGIPPWNWRDTSTNGGGNHSSYGGRVILVKCGDYTKKIGIDGSAEAIKEAIKSAFGLRTRRQFWLEDEDEVVRSLDRDMPLGTYTLHLDEDVVVPAPPLPPSLREKLGPMIEDMRTMREREIALEERMREREGAFQEQVRAQAAVFEKEMRVQANRIRILEKDVQHYINKASALTADIEKMRRSGPVVKANTATNVPAGHYGERATPSRNPNSS